MNRIRFIVLAIVAVTLLSQRATLAQEPEVPDLPKPLAMRGSIEVKVDEKGNLIVTPKMLVPEERMGTKTVCTTVMDSVEQTYEVMVDGKTETRTRVVAVPRQVQEQVTYKYNVGVNKQEASKTLINPRVLYPTSPHTKVPTGQFALMEQATGVENSDSVLFVNTSSDGYRVARLLDESNRRLFELTTLSSDEQKVDYIVVLNETYDFSPTDNDGDLIEEPQEPAAKSAREINRAVKPGVITSIVQNSDNITIRLKYSITICREEARTRTVNVVDKKTGQITPTEQSYTICIGSPEDREMTSVNPRLFTGIGQGWLQEIPDVTRLKVSDSVWIVDTAANLNKLDATLREADRLLGEVGSGRQHDHAYAILINEHDKNATASDSAGDANMLSERKDAPVLAPAPAPAPAAESAPPAWPLPAEKTAWINSLPFTQKNLNGKAMVLWFFEEGCPKCRAHWKELNSLPLDYRGKPVVFVAVNSGNSPEVVAEYVKKNKVNLAVIADTDRRLEKFAGVGEISLENIWQAVIMTPDGQLHRADANDLDATAKEAMKLAR